VIARWIFEFSLSFEGSGLGEAGGDDVVRVWRLESALEHTRVVERLRAPLQLGFQGTYDPEDMFLSFVKWAGIHTGDLFLNSILRGPLNEV
jgi:hypothetical protein